MSAAALIPVLLLAPACRRPRPVPAPAIQVQVTSTPAQAALFLGKQALGEAPRDLQVASAGDLLKLTATRGGEPLVEERIRFLSGTRAEVHFLFGEGASVMARTLGAARILVFDYGSAVTFELDRSDLKPAFLPLLAQQAQLLNSHFAGLPVNVCGHTDAQGGAEHNLALSLQRARAVADVLGRAGVPAAALKVQGFGSAYPVADNGTDEGRAMNRRTEVILPVE
jgi:outer membrane protein OmpA-like peptidoglycan-associated protein